MPGYEKRGKRGPERELEGKRAEVEMCKNRERVVPKSTLRGSGGGKQRIKKTPGE